MEVIALKRKAYGDQLRTARGEELLLERNCFGFMFVCDMYEYRRRHRKVDYIWDFVLAE